MSRLSTSHERDPVPAPRALSRRLESLLQLVGSARCLADIGTDHALLPAHGVLRGVCEVAIGVDLREQPLRRANETLALLGVSDRVTLRRGDGLSALAGVSVDAVVMAGLSGRTMLAWCRASTAVVQRVQRLVVQPNGELPALRSWAYSAGLWLVDESICREHGRVFVSCAFTPGSGPDPVYTESELALDHAFELGPWLVRRREPEAGAYYARESARLAKLVAAGRIEHAVQLSAYAEGCRLLTEPSGGAPSVR